MREPDVVGGEVTSVHLELRIVVWPWLPSGKPRFRPMPVSSTVDKAIGEARGVSSDLRATAAGDRARFAQTPGDRSRCRREQRLHPRLEAVRER
jgi:hypothetical protein